MAKVYDRSSRMRTISFLLVFLSLTFCQKEERDFEISFAFPSDPPSLDPLYATDLVSQKLARFLFAGLYEFQNSEIKQNLVKEDLFLPTKPFPKLIINLKSDNGLLADDVVFSIKRLLQDGSPRRGDYLMIKDIVKTSNSSFYLLLDENTVEREIKEKLALPFASILSQKSFRNNDSFDSFGLYRVEEWKKNEFLKLDLKDKNQSQFPKTILIRILPQSTTALFLYKKNKIDSFKLTDFLLTIPEADKNHTKVKQGKSIQYVAINHKNPCFDKKFRQALNFAIPRELIIQKLLENRADPIIGPVPKPFFDSVFKNDQMPLYNFDRNKSLSLLKDSKCYPKILETELEFRMRGDDENQAKGRAIVQSLRDIGLKVRLLGMEKAPLYKENGEGKGDLTLLTWYSDFPSVWNFIDPLFHEKKLGNGGNRSHYINSKLTKRLDQKRNFEDARNLIHEVEEDAPIIFLWSIQENYLVSDKFIRYESLSDFL